jgi:hypothetical protein
VEANEQRDFLLAKSTFWEQISTLERIRLRNGFGIVDRPSSTRNKPRHGEQNVNLALNVMFIG